MGGGGAGAVDVAPVVEMRGRGRGSSESRNTGPTDPARCSSRFCECSAVQCSAAQCSAAHGGGGTHARPGRTWRWPGLAVPPLHPAPTHPHTHPTWADGEACGGGGGRCRGDGCGNEGGDGGARAGAGGGAGAGVRGRGGGCVAGAPLPQYGARGVAVAAPPRHHHTSTQEHVSQGHSRAQAQAGRCHAGGLVGACPGSSVCASGCVICLAVVPTCGGHDAAAQANKPSQTACTEAQTLSAHPPIHPLHPLFQQQLHGGSLVPLRCRLHLRPTACCLGRVARLRGAGGAGGCGPGGGGRGGAGGGGGGAGLGPSPTARAAGAAPGAPPCVGGPEGAGG